MAETRFQGPNSTSPSVSYIPVMATPAPRKTSSRSPSGHGFGLPHFSLLPSPRVPSTNGSPSSTLSGTSNKRSVSPTPPPGGNTGIPKFRSLRNMLPFGPKQTNHNATAPSSRKPSNPPVAFTSKQALAELKHRRSSSSIPTPSSHITNSAKNGFMTLGPRTSLSLGVEKSLPLPPLIGRSRSEDLGSSPVITIAPPTMGQLNSSMGVMHITTGLPSPDDPFQKPAPTVLVTNTFQGDLSTIVESELSNGSMSKHLPSLDTSDEGLCPQARTSEAESTEEEGELLVLAQLAKQVHKKNASILRAQDLDVSVSSSPATDKAANLSASWEAGLAEFRRSMGMRMHDNDRSAGASSSSSDSPIAFPSPSQEHVVPTPTRSTTQLSSKSSDLTHNLEHEDEQVSFELSSLDPDLAALLSPNNMPKRHGDDGSAAIIAAIDSVTPPPPMHSSASPSPEPADASARPSFDADDIWLSVASSRRTSGESRRRTLGLQSSPVRKSRPSSLALSTSSHATVDPSRRTSTETTPINAGRLAVSPPDFKSPVTSAEDLTEAGRRPLLGRSYSALAGPSTADDGSRRRGPTSRLYANIARPSTTDSIPKGRVVSDSNRPFLRNAWEREDVPSGVRAASSLGLSTNTRRPLGASTLERPGTSLSRSGGGALSSARNRKRSISVTADSRKNVRMTPDWMGPRTARAFAAAGLLDMEREPPLPSRADSRLRMATPRTSTERDYRLNGGATSSGSGGVSSSLYAPSRASFSDLRRSGSWGRRRSASRTMTMAELSSARGESPVTAVTSSTPTSSNPKTAFSGSTATSLSCGSPHQQYQSFHVESALTSLKEKHSSEMEALLGALADSQRTSKTLREENTQLYGRIRDLEDQIRDLIEQLEVARRAPPQPQMPSSFVHTMLRHSRPNSQGSSAEGSTAKRPSRMQTYVRSSNASAADDSDSAPDVHLTTVHDAGARLSPSFATARKRASTASSVFPTLPSNMSMLLHDEGEANGYASLRAHSQHSYTASPSPSPSPTLMLNRLVSAALPSKVQHAGKPYAASIGSGASISISAEMSVLSSLPGSPESLQLRPEHEKHLGDMMSLDFSVLDSD